MVDDHGGGLGARLRAERKKRGWDTLRMAEKLRAAAEHPHKMTAIDNIQRNIERWEAGHVTRLRERYRLLYVKAFGLADEGELFGDDLQAGLDSPAVDADDGVLSGCGEEVELTKRRDALKLGVVASASPELLHRALRDAAAEAMEFTRLAGATGVGPGTFAHLEAVLTELDRSYSLESPAVLFATASAYRRRVAELIDGPHTLKQARELYVYAAWLSELMAWLAHCLGETMSAEAWAIDAFAHADQAGHDELCAWATDAMASVALYTDRYEAAVVAARRGIAKVPPGHPLGVKLRTQAARAHARLGHRAECDELIREAGELYERLPARSPRRLAMDTGSIASFAMTDHPASAYLWLGDFRRAKEYAESAVATQEDLPEAARTPIRGALARIDLGIALAELGEPDEAAALGHQVLATPTPRLVHPVRSRARELDRTLMARYPTLDVVRDYHEASTQLVRAVAT